MEALLNPAAWLGALLIFVMRVADMSLDTIRLLYVVRADRELIGLLLLYSKSERADVVKTELIELLRSLSQDLGENFIHEESVEYQVASDPSPSI